MSRKIKRTGIDVEYVRAVLAGSRDEVSHQWRDVFAVMYRRQPLLQQITRT